MDGKRNPARTVAATAALLLLGLGWSAVPAVRAAIRYREPRLVEIFAIVGTILAISSAGLFVALRRQSVPFGPPGVALLLLFGAPSAVTGANPGLTFHTLGGAFGLIVALGLVAGAIAAARSRRLGWTVSFGTLFAGAVTASFMVGWAPVIATFVIRN